jgi:cytochrome c-type biogenesis protein CcmH
MSGDVIPVWLHDRLYATAGRLLAAAGLILAVAAGGPGTAAPLVNPVDFDTPEQEAQYQKLVRELRCTVCQSETIYESNAALAGDMRRRVYEMTAAGSSEQEIIDFLVHRYGDYVRYRPAFQANTVLLWTSPFLILVVGGLIWMQVVRQRRRLVTREGLTAQERDALERFQRGE